MWLSSVWGSDRSDSLLREDFISEYKAQVSWREDFLIIIFLLVLLSFRNWSQKVMDVILWSWGNNFRIKGTVLRLIERIGTLCHSYWTAHPMSGIISLSGILLWRKKKRTLLVCWALLLAAESILYTLTNCQVFCMLLDPFNI